jgi:hypothetical protein
VKKKRLTKRERAEIQAVADCVYDTLTLAARTFQPWRAVFEPRVTPLDDTTFADGPFVKMTALYNGAVITIKTGSEVDS